MIPEPIDLRHQVGTIVSDAFDALNDRLIEVAEATDNHQVVLNKYIAMLEREAENMRVALALVRSMEEPR